MSAATTAAPVAFTAWEDLSELEQLASEYSDFHKEAYGFRPRNDVSGWTVEDFRREFADLGRVCERNNAERAEAERNNVARFETLVTKLVTVNGAKDRATAIRWLADAEGTGEDREFLCYCYGLPYGYFK